MTEILLCTTVLRAQIAIEVLVKKGQQDLERRHLWDSEGNGGNGDISVGEAEVRAYTCGNEFFYCDGITRASLFCIPTSGPGWTLLTRFESSQFRTM